MQKCVGSFGTQYIIIRELHWSWHNDLLACACFRFVWSV